MRSSIRLSPTTATISLPILAGAATLAALLLVGGPSFADPVAPATSGTALEPLPPPPPSSTPPTASPASTPAAPAAESPDALPSWAPPLAPRAPAGADTPSADKPEPAADTRRAEGVRLGLDLGFERAFSGAEDRLNAGTPTLLPLGVSLSFRTSPSLLLGLHGYAALGSRDDCISADSCRARAYAFGGHIETPLSRGQSFIPWLRYAVNYEILYQGGAPLDPAGHVYRGAFDFFDLRVGGDFVVHRGSEGKTARIGPFAGLVGGILMNQSGVSNANGGSGVQPRNLERSSGSAHLWFAMGVRATLDP